MRQFDDWTVRELDVFDGSALAPQHQTIVLSLEEHNEVHKQSHVQLHWAWRPAPSQLTIVDHRMLG